MPYRLPCSQTELVGVQGTDKGFPAYDPVRKGAAAVRAARLGSVDSALPRAEYSNQVVAYQKAASFTDRNLIEVANRLLGVCHGSCNAAH